MKITKKLAKKLDIHPSMTRDECHVETDTLVTELTEIEYRILVLKSQGVDNDEHRGQFFQALTRITEALKWLKYRANAFKHNKENDTRMETVGEKNGYTVTLNNIWSLISNVHQTAQSLCDHHNKVINDLTPDSKNVNQAWRVYNPWTKTLCDPAEVFDLRNMNWFELHLSTQGETTKE